MKGAAEARTNDVRIGVSAAGKIGKTAGGQAGAADHGEQGPNLGACPQGEKTSLLSCNASPEFENEAANGL
jgi:hypothetical protein